MKTKLSVLLALAALALLLCAPALAAEIVDSGTCGKYGDNLTWTLDSDGLLTISGEGEMADYDNSFGENRFLCIRVLYWIALRFNTGQQHDY